jgi:hypothetical protein
MDMSWDICKAYVLLGHLPPVEYCDLPMFAGGMRTDVTVAEAAVRSCECAVSQMTDLLNKAQRSLELAKEDQDV